MTEWQPIATAPKDGTRFLALCGKSVEIIEWFSGWSSGVVTQARQPAWGVSVDQDTGCRSVDDEGWDTGTGRYLVPHWPPTHWMPLPDLPASRGGSPA